MNTAPIKTKLCILAMATFALGAFAWTGCSDDDHDHSADGGAHTSKFPACQEIMDACHEVDMGDPGAIHDCHEKAHDDGATEADCIQAKDSCIKVCAEAKLDAGASADGGEEHDGH